MTNKRIELPAPQTLIVEDDVGCRSYAPDQVREIILADRAAQQRVLAEQAEPVADMLECLAIDIEAIDVMYRGDPSYEHDGYWMRREAARAVRDLAARLAPLPAPQVAQAGHHEEQPDGTVTPVDPTDRGFKAEQAEAPSEECPLCRGRGGWENTTAGQRYSWRKCSRCATQPTASNAGEREELLRGEIDAITELNHAQWLALENVRTLAARHRKEEWAQHLLRWCEEAGNASRTLRAALSATPPAQAAQDSADSQMLAALMALDAIQSGPHPSEREVTAAWALVKPAIRAARGDEVNQK